MIRTMRIFSIECDVCEDEGLDCSAATDRSSTRSEAAAEGWVRAREHGSGRTRLIDVCPRCARSHGLDKPEEPK